MPIQYVADRPDRSEEQSFLSENDAAMNNMMADMTIKPTGDVDRDFVAMMVPHHQGAVDMAKAELKYGHNEQLRRLAREIVANAAAGDHGHAARRERTGNPSAVQSPEQSSVPRSARPIADDVE